MSGKTLLPPCPPWRIKVTSMMPEPSAEIRKKAINLAGYNTFLLRSKHVGIDLLTDSGTNAMYDEQWSAIWRGDEAYAGPESFYRLKRVIKNLYGAREVVPTHQGRAAEHIASKVLVKKGDYVFSNMYFTTSRAHVEALGGIWKDVSIKEANDPESLHPFKGNIDLELLDSMLQKYAKRTAFVRIEACLNMAGGQPFSMDNLNGVKFLTKKYEVPLLIDATRAIENCYFIKVGESPFSSIKIKDILFEMCHDADFIVVSAKKDAVVNIGGFLCVRDPAHFEKVKNLLVLYEGFIHYGGLAGRDMEAMAKGLQIAATEKHIKYRVEQTRYFGQLLAEAGIPIVLPVGGHGVYVNAENFLPHVPQEQYTAQALAAAIYEECAVRGMERGLASAGRDPKTGKEHKGGLELVRLTIPRMVYTESHFAHAAEGIRRVFENRNNIKGLRLTYEPPFLRFFQARFERLK